MAPIDTVFLARKQAIIDVVRAKGCKEWKYIQAEATSWSKLLEILIEFSKTFDCDPTYLDDLLTVFTDVELIDNGVYYNKSSITINNPVFVVNCQHVDVVLNLPAKEVNITYDSLVDSLLVNSSAEIGILNVGGRADVVLLSVEEGSCIDALLIKSCGVYESKVRTIADDSCIRNYAIDSIATVPTETGGGGTGDNCCCGDKNYIHRQYTPSAVWVIPHHLNKLVNVTVTDSAGTEIWGDVQHDSYQQCTITFSAAFSGEAVCD